VTLGEFVKRYRKAHNLNQREFGEMSGVTSGYLSMLENNRNPKTGDPIIPNIATVKRMAQAMNMPLEELLREIDDSIISIAKEPTITEDDELMDESIRLLRQLPTEKKRMVLDLLRSISHGAGKG